MRVYNNIGWKYKVQYELCSDYKTVSSRKGKINDIPYFYMLMPTV